MDPIKQEGQMKNKLEQRRIEPASQSWEILSARLDADQKKKGIFSFWSLNFGIGMAASLVGIALVTTLYFNYNFVEIKTPVIVDTEVNPNQETKNQNIEIPIKNENVVIQELKSEENITKDISKKSDSKEIIYQKNPVLNKESQDNLLVQVEKGRTQKSLEETVNIKKSTLSFEEQKIQDVVAQINDLKSNGNEVTDEEIENLLKKAQKEILTNKIYNENTRTVDANALLQDVEEDLQQSFRTKVFEALKTGYESVRTAVAERNN